MLETPGLRQRAENQVLTELRIAHDEGTARLLINQKHRFFFDHPQDHVPGLLLLEGGHQLAERLLPAGEWLASELQACFSKYCLFDSPVKVQGKRSPLDEGWQCEIVIAQRLQVRASMHWVFIPMPPTRVVQLHSTAEVPVEKALVNKKRLENVMIGQPYTFQQTGHECHALLPHPANLLADSRQQTHPLYLLEAFMQLQRSLNYAQPVRLRDILLGISMQVFKPLAVGSAFHLQMEPQLDNGEARHFNRGADLWAAGQRFARCEMHSGRIQRKKHTVTQRSSAE
ncbi:AfsA-related hotdog domain-containing protein [Raoultella ornithinolytica]|uniref:AfsA-related hotdog domain-containing protein n=1 Tax=Raoultella ornithinolytica TaxID=54291 RepID=UPI003590226D